MTHDVTANPKYISFVLEQTSSSSHNTNQVKSFESLPGFETHLTQIFGGLFAFVSALSSRELVDYI